MCLCCWDHLKILHRSRNGLRELDVPGTDAFEIGAPSTKEDEEINEMIRLLIVHMNENN